MKIRNISLVISFCVSTFVFAPFASSEELGNLVTMCNGLPQEECNKKREDLVPNQPAVDVQADFLVPDSPAFDVLGIKPEKTINPSSARSLGLSLLSGADPQGNIQTGLALDTAPYQFSNVTLEEYRNNDIKKFLSRLQLSIGTAKGSSDDDKSVRAAVGLRFTLIDAGDPRMDLGLDDTFGKIVASIIDSSRLKKYELVKKKIELEVERTAAEKAGEVGRVEQINKQIALVDGELVALAKSLEGSANKAWDKALEEHKKGAWNASSVALGIAPVFFSESGSYGDLESEGYAIYCTFAYGFDGFQEQSAKDREKGNWWARNAQVLLHARYTDNQMEALSENEGYRKQDTTVYGGQFRIQGPKIWSDSGGDLVFSLEGSIVEKDFEDGGSESVTSYAGGVEVKPIKNSGFTLKGVIGGQSGGSDDDSGFIVASLNWAL